jgi:glycerophosphoryl diester phosphodiesterase
MKRLRSETGKVLVLGHRGAMACAPENTMASFEEGLRQGADLLELDVHLCASGEVVVLHDERVDRTTDGTGEVASLTLSQLKALDAGSWFDEAFAGQRIPTLDEVLAWAHGRIPIVIEIKNGPNFYAGIEEQVVALIRKHDSVESSMVISFDHTCLPPVKVLCPAIPTGILYSARLADPVAAARAAQADSLRPVWPYVTAESVRQAHAAGLSVDPWGRGLDPVRLRALGVDSVAADHPAQARAQLDA